MPSKRSPSAVKADPLHGRQQIFPRWWIVLALVVALALLSVLFPRDLARQIKHSVHADNVGLAYLHALLEADPNNAELRLTLTDRLLYVGELSRARATLAPLLVARRDSARKRQHLLAFLIHEREIYGHAPGSAARAAGLHALRQQLKMLLALPWNKKQPLQLLAKKAQILGEQRLAVASYIRLAKLDPPAASSWLASAARSALAMRDYRNASTLYFNAGAKTSVIAQQRAYFMSAVNALRSANLSADALQAAEQHLDALAGDIETLYFMVDLARSANQPQMAENYVKRLLELASRSAGSQREPELPTQKNTWHLRWFTPAFAATTAPDTPLQKAKPLPAWDERLYRLSYDVFLANQNVNDAYAIAAAAVRHRPQDNAWRVRLARSAEWTARPEEALQQWLYIFARRQDPEAWTSIVRLAQAMHDDDSLLRAYTILSNRRPLDRHERAELLAAYERLGRPQDALRYLHALQRRQPERALLEEMAALYERMGQTQRASDLYNEILQRYHAPTTVALEKAKAELRQGKLTEAYAVLRAAERAALISDTAYWRLRADLAWRLQRDDEAVPVYRTLMHDPGYTEEEVARLITLLRTTHSEDAARYAEAAWEKFHTPEFLLTALELLLQTDSDAHLHRLLTGLSAADMLSLQNNSRFFSLRGRHYQERGNSRAAVDDYRRAIERDPATPALRADLLWLLIEQPQKSAELHRYLRLWRTEAQRSTVLWKSFAAAHMSLGEPRAALPYYRRIVKQDQDYLWLLDYAEALAQSGQTGMAGRIRRHAWLSLRQRLSAVLPATIKRADLELAVRLSLRQAPAHSAPLLRRLLQQERQAGMPAQQVTHELMLAWTLSTERHETARLWLANNYARLLATPHWARVALALAENDSAAINKLLSNPAERLAPADALAIAQRAENHAGAVQHAFTALEQDDTNDELHSALTDSVIASANVVMGKMASITQGALDWVEQQLGAVMQLHRHLRVEATYTQSDYDDIHSISSILPGLVQQFDVALHYRRVSSAIKLALQRRNALGDVNAVLAAYRQHGAHGLSTTWEYGRNQLADETAALRLGGAKDQAQVTFYYPLDQRNHLGMQLAQRRYYSQQREYLAQGHSVRIEAGRRMRRAYPDVSVNVSALLQNYRADGEVAGTLAALVPAEQDAGVNTLIPQSSNQLELSVGVGEAYRDRYTRALRPYARAAVNYNSVVGKGHDIRMGIAGSPLGNDLLQFYISRNQGGEGVNETGSELALRYQLFF